MRRYLVILLTATLVMVAIAWRVAEEGTISGRWSAGSCFLTTSLNSGVVSFFGSSEESRSRLPWAFRRFDVRLVEDLHPAPELFSENEFHVRCQKRTDALSAVPFELGHWGHYYTLEIRLWFVMVTLFVAIYTIAVSGRARLQFILKYGLAICLCAGVMGAFVRHPDLDDFVQMTSDDITYNDWTMLSPTERRQAMQELEDNWGLYGARQWVILEKALRDEQNWSGNLFDSFNEFELITEEIGDDGYEYPIEFVKPQSR